MKSHPHPERPDRLRAIAASLATAGIYFPHACPQRLFWIHVFSFCTNLLSSHLFMSNNFASYAYDQLDDNCEFVQVYFLEDATQSLREKLPNKNFRWWVVIFLFGILYDLFAILHLHVNLCIVSEVLKVYNS